MGIKWKQWQILFSWAPKSLQTVTAMKLKDIFLLGRKAMTNLDSILKRRDISLPTKVYISQSYSFSSGHVLMWELDHKESWVPKNWRLWTVVLEKTLKNPLDCKEIKPVHLKGDQSWVFFGRTDVEAPVLWPADGKSWLIGKDPEKGTTEDEMVEWHHRLNGCEFEPTLGDGKGQRSLVCCSPRSCKESDTA